MMSNVEEHMMPPVYERNFLMNVICRADFPVILRLGQERPVEFQESISGRFPKTLEAVAVEVEIPSSDPQGARIKKPVLRWEFHTRNMKKKAILERSSLILEDQDYEHFDAFEEFFNPCFTKLEEIYHPPVVTRLGLRYQNLLKPPTGSPFDWHRFLHQALIGHLDFECNGQRTRDDHTIRFDTERSHVILQYGVHNSEFPAPMRNREFKLDIDCYIRDDLDFPDVSGRLRELNEDAVDVFETCIGESWRQMMQEG